MFLVGFGAYDVQFEGFGGDYVFLGGIGSERRKASHASENQITTGVHYRRDATGRELHRSLDDTRDRGTFHVRYVVITPS